MISFPLAMAPCAVTPVSPVSADAGGRAAELLIADGASADIAELIAHAPLASLRVAPGADALACISEALAGRQWEVLHIVAHGRAGAISLGGQWIDARGLAAASRLLIQWRVRTIALWSCETGQDATLAELLAALTGAQVLASAGPLGMLDSGPAWEVRDVRGAALPARFAAPFVRATMDSWPHRLAKLSFVNAYAVNTATTVAGKEANAVDFSVTALNVARVDDKTGGQNFSGNDVVVEAVIDNVTYYGWISRPIKSGGVVRGYYFWTDPQFAALSNATTDGNADGDSNAADNLGFVLVVDQAWFDAQPTVSGSGGLLKNVGTSSDRVDAGMNALLAVNSVPVPVNDSASLVEDAGAQSGNVLANDSDANNDALAVTGFSIGGVAGTLGVAKVIANVGSFTLAASGAYSFTPVANYAGIVPLVSYTISDGRGGTGTASLSINVAQVNDAPSGADKTISARENSAYTFSAADFGFSDSSDNPANTLLSVKIATLPDSAKGALTLNGVAVLAGAYIAAADITKLQFVPVANGSGTGYASFTFQVRDNGGGSGDTDLSPNTISFDLADVNSAPVAVADSAAAVEAGGMANASAGTNPSGNVLTNDTDSDSGDTLTVASASGSGGASTAVGTNTAISGSYGTLTISSDGSYSYTVANSNTKVQALQTTSSALSDSFTYTVKDSAGLSSTARLTVSIGGANDAIVAVNDSNFAVSSTTSGYRINPSGNVLSNDSDVDSGDSMTVTRASKGASLGGTIATVGSGGSANGAEHLTYLTFTLQGAGAISVGDVVTVSGGNTSTAALPANTTVVSISNGATKTVTLSSPGMLELNTALVFTGNNTNNASVNTLGTASTTVVAITGASASITSGMAVTGTGVANGTTVSSVVSSGGVYYATLSQALSGALGTDLVFGSSGTSIAGNYGTLLLQADGSYTYTVTNTTAAGSETFTYEVKDGAGLLSTAVLTIDVANATAAAPSAVADSASIGENSASVTGNVTSNDSGGATVGAAWGSQAASTTVTGGGVTLAGTYGSLTIDSSGAYTYTLTPSHATVDALNASQTLSESFSYRIGGGGAGYATAALTVTINGANDAPTANADSASATEAGGSANGSAGVNPSGNVITNDSDPDNADVLSIAMAGTGSANTAVSAGTSSGNGLSVAGAYGTLVLGADGSYSYTVDNSNATVQALGASSGGLTDTFTYQLRDATGATSTSTLTVTVLGANDAPVNTLGSSPTIAEGVSGALAGISVGDVDDSSLTVKLAVLNGTISIGTLGAATVSAGADGSASVTLSGTTADLNAALATLSYQGAADFSGTDTLTVTTTDAANLADIDTLDIAVSPDARALSVTAPTVNEASPYAVFTVGGATGQKVTLALTAGSAGAGADYVASLEYYDGANWQSYDGNPVTMGAATLLVRAPILNDILAEGSESFRLSAFNKAGVGANGDAAIVDAGNGVIHDGSVTAGAPTASTANLDDDRALSVTSSTVNENSPYAMFQVTGVSGQQVVLSLANGNASNADHGSTIEYYDGAAWQTYSGSATLPAGGTLTLRVAIVDDAVYEGPEVFGLVATNGSGRTFLGTATIVDDGSGSIYPGTLAGGAVDSNTSGLDNDLSVAVSAHGPVNEGSAYAMFTVTATAGEVLNLGLASSGAHPATVSGFTMQFSTDGSSWTTYDSATQPLVPGGGAVHVRVAIGSEQDSTIEGAETFTLSASTSSGAGASHSAVATIIDDGSGSRYDGGLTAGVPNASTSNLDHDVLADTTAPTIAVSSNAATLGIGQSATITFTLSEASTNFTAADVSVSGGTLSGFSGSGASYTATFTPTASSTANGVVSVASGTFSDGAANPNADGADSDNTVTMSVDTVPVVVVPPPAPAAPAALPAPTVTIVEDADNNGILSRHELSGALDVSIGLPAGAASGDVLTVVSGASTQRFVLSAADIASGSLATSFAAPAPGATISVSASVTSGTVPGASGSDSAVRGSGALLALTAVTPDTGVVGDFITTEKSLVFSGTAETGTLVTLKLNGATLGSVIAVDDKWTYDNSAAPLKSGDNTITLVNGNQPDDTVSVVVRIFSAELNPRDDDGASNTDHQTSVTQPEFILKAENIMAAGDSARLLAPDGKVVGTLAIDAAAAAAGRIDVPTEQLDDGSYTFLAQILDAKGNVKASQPVTVTIVTDRDGVMPSVELAANGGDFNHDGIADWQQNNVAQLPLTSVDAFAAGKAAPASAFGAIMAGLVPASNGGAAVQLDANAQLLDVGVHAAPAPLPSNTSAATPMLAFTVTGANNSTLADLDPNRAGLQTRVVIDLPKGVQANVFLKFDAHSGQYYSFNDDQRLDTFDDGATLLDTNRDGLVDRIVVTLTDGARGDEDGVANGIIVDPGMLANQGTPVYSVLLASGDRYYTTDAREAAKAATGTGNVFEGARFDSLAASAGGVQVYAKWQPFTQDWWFGADKQADPYLCYDKVAGTAGFMAADGGAAIGQSFHLYLNKAGQTQLVTQAEAASLGLVGKGFADKGAQFSTTTGSAFVFDAEAFLIANKDSAQIQGFVQTLAGKFQHSSDAGFIDAVEQQYLEQVSLVGVAHGGSATVAELNAVFGTHFL